jgi:hypothetical protein
MINEHLLPGMEFKDCLAQWQSYLKTYPNEARTYGLIYALVPIPFGWVIIWEHLVLRDGYEPDLQQVEDIERFLI